jgi:hypothetical protein
VSSAAIDGGAEWADASGLPGLSRSVRVLVSGHWRERQSKPLCTTPLASTPRANRMTTTISMSGLFFIDNFPDFQSIEIII